MASRLGPQGRTAIGAPYACAQVPGWVAYCASSLPQGTPCVSSLFATPPLCRAASRKKTVPAASREQPTLCW